MRRSQRPSRDLWIGRGMNGIPSACGRAMARLSDYLDENLEGGPAAELEKHLRACDRCLAFAHSSCRSIKFCRSYEPSLKPRPLDPSTRAELDSAWQKPSRFGRAV